MEGSTSSARQTDLPERNAPQSLQQGECSTGRKRTSETAEGSEPEAKRRAVDDWCTPEGAADGAGPSDGNMRTALLEADVQLLEMKVEELQVLGGIEAKFAEGKVAKLKLQLSIAMNQLKAAGKTIEGLRKDKEKAEADTAAAIAELKERSLEFEKMEQSLQADYTALKERLLCLEKGRQSTKVVIHDSDDFQQDQMNTVSNKISTMESTGCKTAFNAEGANEANLNAEGGQRRNASSNLPLSTPTQGWETIPFELLDMIKEKMSRSENLYEQHSSFKNARLVNKHWHQWVGGSTRRLTVELNPNEIRKMLRTCGHKFANLRELVIPEDVCNGPHWSTKYLRGLERFTCIDLSGPHVARSWLEWLTHSTRLKTLKLCPNKAAVKLTTAGFETIGEITSLETLVLTGMTTLTVEHGQAIFYGLSSLTRLELAFRTTTQRTSHEVRTISHLRSLSELKLSGCHIHNSEMHPWRRLQSLTSLTLADCKCFYMAGGTQKLRRVGFSEIRVLPALRYLSFEGCGPERECFAGAVAPLRSLSMTRWLVPDDSVMTALNGLTELTMVEMSGIRGALIRSWGLMENLRVLRYDQPWLPHVETLRTCFPNAVQRRADA